MDTLNDTQWDIIIDGTGISQSLLALSLSRSDKRILHLDRNDYYGGSEAAFSLQEAQTWADEVKERKLTSGFRNVIIETPPPSTDDVQHVPKLSFPRAYSIALAPQLIYTDSALLETLVKAKVHQQVEFLPIGAWWIFTPDGTEGMEDPKDGVGGRLVKVPTNREDIAFSDAGLDLRGKRALLRVIRFIADYETQEDVWRPYADQPFGDFLQKYSKVPTDLHGLLLSLSLTPFTPEHTKTSFALPRIAQHLRSTGRLGPGFSAVTPRWGGLSEICQVGCRAAAVGGAVYALKQQIVPHDAEHVEGLRLLTLDNGDQVRGFNLVSDRTHAGRTSQPQQTWATSSISVIGGALASLFPEMPAGSPPSAGTVVAFPSGSLLGQSGGDTTSESLSPVYLIVHNHHTGECPKSQCIIYASTLLTGRGGTRLVDAAVTALLRTARTDDCDASPILWSMHFEQCDSGSQSDLADSNDHRLSSPALDIVFDDSILEKVRNLWARLSGNDVDANDFMNFLARAEDSD